MDKSELNAVFEAVNKHFEKLRKMPNVLNVGVGIKYTDKKDTGKLAIVVYVSKKKPLASLSPQEIIPKELEGVITDVIELSSNDFVLGDTAPSRLSPAVQRMIASGVKKK